MQEIQLIGAGQIVDRRLRQTHLQNQALKCPRCDSLNTKFCYYNNYNLSQPRHFCKSCRRYWTKGGVLRNVPVGGGCRKSSKRSKSSKSSDEMRSKLKSNTSNSSSESSSLTGAGNAAVATDLAAAPSTCAATPPSVSTVFGFREVKYLFPPNLDSEMISAAVGGGDNGGEGFTDIGNFSNLNNETTPNNYTTSTYDAVSPFQQFDRTYDQWQLCTEEGKLQGIADAARGGYIDPTVQIDQSSSLRSDPLNWQHQMLGLTSAVDLGYWSQQQWSNADNNAHSHDLYLP